MAQMRGTWNRGVAVALMLSGAVAGCSKGPPPLVPVQGTVQNSDGTPVADRILMFAPLDDENRNSTPQAVVGKDGTFHLKCVPGRYRVTMTRIPSGGAGPGQAGRPALPERKAPDKFGPHSGWGPKPWEITIAARGKEGLLLTVRK
jgi:hypothetical protein